MRQTTSTTSSIGMFFVIGAVLSCGGSPAASPEPEAIGSVSEDATRRCGVERWSVKVGTNSAAPSVDVSSAYFTSIDDLSSYTPPSPLSTRTPRQAPVETTTWYLENVTLVKVKRERDSDYHLVLQDDSTGSTMIAEIPDPTCTGSSPWRPAISYVRRQMNARMGTARTKDFNETITIAGVGMFDLIHGQEGVADNGIELHPVIAMCFGVDCSF